MITRKELSEQLGVSQSTISNDSARGMPVDSVERARRWRKKHIQPGRMKGIRRDTVSDEDTPGPDQAIPPTRQTNKNELSGAGYDPEDVAVYSFVGARERREHYQAELSRLTYERELKKLMQSSEVIKAFVEAGTMIRLNLESMVHKITPVLVGMDTEHSITVFLQAEVDSVLQHMSDAFERLANKENNPNQADLPGFDISFGSEGDAQ